MKKPVNKISAFNLIKGIGILIVIYVHGRWDFLDKYSAVPSFINHLIEGFSAYSLMSVFLCSAVILQENSR